jgi:fructoselysine-6-P-deglycase FrlB-like protein
MKASSQILCATLLALVSCGGSAFLAQAAGTSLDRELEEYATAACLIAQKDDEYLKDQGYRWSAIIVQGRGFPSDVLAPVDAAVKDQLAKGDMVIVRDETSPTGSKALPLVFCSRIIDFPKVHAAIGAARTKLRRSKVQ